MKFQYALILEQLTREYATFGHPDNLDISRYSLAVKDWVELDRPVRITVTVEKL